MNATYIKKNQQFTKVYHGINQKENLLCLYVLTSVPPITCHGLAPRVGFKIFLFQKKASNLNATTT